jgi:hypothetical protein
MPMRFTVTFTNRAGERSVVEIELTLDEVCDCQFNARVGDNVGRAYARQRAAQCVPPGFSMSDVDPAGIQRIERSH